MMEDQVLIREDEESTTCDRCGDIDALEYGFGRLGRKADGAWGVVATYSQVLCDSCARRSGGLR